MARIDEIAEVYGVTPMELRFALRQQNAAELRYRLMEAAFKRAKRAWKALKQANPNSPQTNQAADDVTALAAEVFLAEKRMNKERQ